MLNLHFQMLQPKRDNPFSGALPRQRPSFLGAIWKNQHLGGDAMIHLNSLKSAAL
jgi:hypothetical protein